ncbi:MAG: hypothetical protein HDS78_03240 [Bacteroidales bacterium]|nr:hypothetical protein [Bacteroidales bacterium]
MSGVFTLEDLDNGYITRERIRNVKNKPSEQLNPEFFTKGIVTALRKIGVFNTDLFSKGDKMAIGVPLDHLSEFVDVILKMHGVSTHKGVIDMLSFIQMSGGSIKSGLCDLLVTQENISIDGERLLSDDVKSILWDPETATLNLTMESDNKSRMVNLPVLSSRRSSNRILSFRIVLMIKMREQAEYLNHIRECCYEIKRSLSPFTQAMSHIREPKIPARRTEDIPVGNIRWDLTANQKENLLSETIQYLKMGFL